MINWSIEAATESGVFDRIIVSTDDDAIMHVAQAAGAEAPFRRPADLANDRASTMPVIRHALDWLKEDGNTIDFACCLYATAPFVQSKSLKAGYETIREDPELQFAFSVTTFAFPIQRGLFIDPKTGQTKMFWPEHEQTRSQDLTEAYHDAGQFYWGRPKAFFEEDGIFTARSKPVLLPRHRVQDIDTEEDWVRAELLFRMLQESDL